MCEKDSGTWYNELSNAALWEHSAETTAVYTLIT